MHLNRTATVRDLGSLSATEDALLDLGQAVMTRLVVYRDRRLCLLKEHELISAALVVGEELGIRMRHVVNTHMLVLKLQGEEASADQRGLTLSQRKMHTYSSRYHGKVAEYDSTAAGKDGCKAKATAMKEYARRYRMIHDHLDCFLL